MKVWLVRRGLHTYKVLGETRSKAKYQAFLVYQSKRKKPADFFSFVVRVKSCKVVR